MTACSDCTKAVSLRDALCPSCGRFLIMDRPLSEQGDQSRSGLAIATSIIVAFFGLCLFVGCLEGRNYERRMQHGQASADGRTIQVVVETWREDHPNTCPSPARLKAAGELSPGSKLTDPWGSPYRVECRSDGVHVFSAGPDREPGTADDISSQDDD